MNKVRAAVIGTGRQGRNILRACAELPDIEISAICDISTVNLELASNCLQENTVIPTQYINWLTLLEREKDIEAVFIATPDWLHSDQAITCMEAGLHVYCETPMAMTLSDACRMCSTAENSGRQLQIGYQHRSNPEYIYAINILLHELELLGDISNMSTVWRRTSDLCLNVADIPAPSREILRESGYHSADEYFNWHLYKKFCRGVMTAQGSHQLDILSWAMRTMPVSAVASGGADFDKNRETPDNIISILEYKTAAHSARASCQINIGTSHDGCRESILGSNGTLLISEHPYSKITVERDDNAPTWEPLIRDGYLKPAQIRIINNKVYTSKDLILSNNHIISMPTFSCLIRSQLQRLSLPVRLNQHPCAPHIDNFVKSIKGDALLNCPPETAYHTLTAGLACHIAAETGDRQEIYYE